MWGLSCWIRDRTHIPCIARRILNHWTTREVPACGWWFLHTSWCGCKVSFPSSSCLGPQNRCSHFTVSWYSWTLSPSHWDSSWSQKLDQLHLFPVCHRQIFLKSFLERKDNSKLQYSWVGDIPGGPVVRTPCFHCRGHRFDSWSGYQDSACCTVRPIYIYIYTWSLWKQLPRWHQQYRTCLPTQAMWETWVRSFGGGRSPGVGNSNSPQCENILELRHVVNRMNDGPAGPSGPLPLWLGSSFHQEMKSIACLSTSSLGICFDQETGRSVSVARLSLGFLRPWALLFSGSSASTRTILAWLQEDEGPSRGVVSPCSRDHPRTASWPASWRRCTRKPGQNETRPELPS